MFELLLQYKYLPVIIWSKPYDFFFKSFSYSTIRSQSIVNMQYLENVMNGSVMKTYGLIKSSKLINFYPLLKSSEDIWFSDDFRGNRSSAIQNKFRPVVQRWLH